MAAALTRALLYRDAPHELESRWIDVRGTRVHYRAATAAARDPPRVVLVHGLGVSGRYLLPTAGRLADAFAVYVPDLPGFGKTSKPPRPLSVEGLADALLAWLGAVELERVTLLGNSLGCQTIVEAAARAPDRVERLVLVGPTMDRYARTLPRQLARLALDTVREHPGLIGLVAYEYLRAGSRRIVATALTGLAHPIEERLRQVRAPVLVVRGERDAIATERWAEELAAVTPDGRLRVVAGSPHAVNYAAPDELTALVRSFVQ